MYTNSQTTKLSIFRQKKDNNINTHYNLPPDMQKLMHMPYRIAGDTHIGLVRESNEDSYAYYANPLYKNFFVAVADGIGGHSNGDIASSSCVRMILTAWKNNDMGNITSERVLKEFLRKEIIKSNEIIYNLNKSHCIKTPMGTTVVAGIFLPKSLIIAHAGDSRCYLVRKKKLKRLTNDHSFVEELLRKKIITHEEAKVHPFAHIISRSVGPVSEMEPEITVSKRKHGDKFIFCTDGLVGQVSDKLIEKIVNESASPEEAVQNLLHAALQEGGEDNITIVCVYT